MKRYPSIIAVVLAVAVLMAFSMARAANEPGELHFQTDLVLGDDPNDDNSLISIVTDVVVDSQGTIYVTDLGFECIHLFSEAGKWLDRYGQLGEGPGDLMDMVVMTMDPQDRMYIAGMGGRVDILDTDWNLLESFKRLNPAEGATSLKLLPDGSLVIAATNVLNQTVLDLYDSNHQPIKSFGDTFGVGQNLDWRMETLYAGGMVAVAPDGTILFSQKAPYELRRYDGEGNLLAATDAGGREFVPSPPNPQKTKGGFSVSYPWGGTGLVVFSDGRSLVSSYRRLGAENVDSLFCLYDAEFNLLATLRREGLHVAVGSDVRDRVFLYSTYDGPQRVQRAVIKILPVDDRQARAR